MSLEQELYDTKQQVLRLIEALNEVTLQVTECSYCGKPFGEGETRERDTMTNQVMHKACFERDMELEAEDNDRIRKAENAWSQVAW